MINNLKILGILIPVLTAIKLLPALPWWAFTIPVWIMGMIIARKNPAQSCFGAGFLAGFIVWTGALLYFDRAFEGTVLSKTGPGLWLIPVFSGIVGGLLTALSLYTGKQFMLSLPKNAGIKTTKA